MSMVTSTISNKKIVNFIYTKEWVGSNVWKCQRDISRKSIGSGLTNLMQHLDQKHLTKKKETRARKIKSYNKASLTNLLYCRKVVTVHGWISSVIHCLLPFYAVKNDDVCAHVRSVRMSLKSFKNYLASSTARIEHNNSLRILDRSALVFDE